MADLMFRYARAMKLRKNEPSAKQSLDNSNSSLGETKQTPDILTSNGFNPDFFHNQPHPPQTSKRNLKDFLQKD